MTALMHVVSALSLGALLGTTALPRRTVRPQTPSTDLDALAHALRLEDAARIAWLRANPMHPTSDRRTP